MKKRAHIIALSALIFFLSPVASWGSDRSLTTADAAIDLPIPDSAAFTALGFGPSLVENPSSPRALAGSVLQGSDAKGNSQTGISIEGAPFLLYHDRRTDLRAYQNDDTSKVLDRTMLSLAAVKGGSEVEPSTRLALGIRVTLWDAGDPRMDKALAACMRSALIDIDVRRKEELDALTDEIEMLQIQRERVEDQIDSASKVESKKRTLKSLEDTVRALIRKTIRLNRQREALLATSAGELNRQGGAAVQACRSNNRFRSALWSRSSWSLGVAPTYTSTPDTGDNHNSTGTAIWTTAAFALKDSGQLILHGSYRSNELVPNRKRIGRFVEQDTVRAGGRVRLGSSDLNFSLEGLYVVEQRQGVRHPDKKIQYGAGVEHRVGDDLWLDVAVRSEAYNAEGNHLSLLGSLKWAYSP